MERATYTTQDTLGKLNLSVQGTRSLRFAKVRKGGAGQHQPRARDG